MDNLLDLFFDSGWGLSLFNEDLLQLDRSMSKSDFLALLALDHRGTTTMGELAADLNAPLSTVTGIVSRLAKKRLLVRERDPRDRRAILARLTPEGAQLADKSQQQLADLLARVQSVLTDEEIGVLISLVQKVLRAMADPGTGDQAESIGGKSRKIVIED